MSDEALADQVAQIRKTTQDLIDARNEATEEKIRKRGEGLAAEKAAIDADAKADAAKWAWVEPVLSITKKVVQNVPGGSAAVDGINTLLLLAGGGAGWRRSRSGRMQPRARRNATSMRRSLASLSSSGLRTNARPRSWRRLWSRSQTRSK